MDEYNLWTRIVQRLKESCLEFDGLWMKRRRLFDTELLIKGLLQLVSGHQKSYFQLLDYLGSDTDFSAAASSFCEARAKLPAFVVGEINRDVLEQWNDYNFEDTWHGYRPHAVDGTRVSLPRSLFEEGFKASGTGYCPQGLVSLLLRLNDRMVCDIRLSARGDERSEAHEHLVHLGKSDLVIYDRGYLSFALLTAHINQGIQAVFRIAKGTNFIPVQNFWKSNKKETVVTINPRPGTYRNAHKDYPEYPLEPLKLRLIKYEIDGKSYVLATTVLDQTISCEDFVTLYSKRWLSEETFKSFKQTLEFETFHSQSLNGIEQEIQAAALFWNLARVVGCLAEPSIKKRKYPETTHDSTKLTSNSVFSRFLAA